jgi:hypothetical protein
LSWLALVDTREGQVGIECPESSALHQGASAVLTDVCGDVPAKRRKFVNIPRLRLRASAQLSTDTLATVSVIV